MAKYRAVLLVPSIVEFESEGGDKHVTEQAKRIARGMGKTRSRARDHLYVPTVMEVVRSEGDDFDDAA